ncbi:8214_t:CDS:2, partial [Gigaspora margarita]
MTNNQAISANDDQVNVSVVYPIVFISYTAIQQSFEYKTCKVIYKKRKGLTRHQNAVRKYNIHREGLYVLPLETINQFKSDLIYIIGNKLKEHFKQSGKQTISFSCLESLPDAYLQLTNILNNSNWDRKFFDNDHQTFVVLFNAQAKKKANCNLFDKNRLSKLTVEWKMKIKRDAKNNQTLAG